MKYIWEIPIDSRIVNYFYPIFMLVLINSAAQANQQERERVTEQASLLVGDGLKLQDKPLKGVGAMTYPRPFYMYRGKAFSMRGLLASYEIFTKEMWSIRGLTRFRTDGYDADDSSDLAGMSDRKNSLDVGAELWLENSGGNIGLDWLTDALGKHRGH